MGPGEYNEWHDGCWCGHGDGAHDTEPPPEGRGMRGDAVVCNTCGWQCNSSKCQNCGRWLDQYRQFEVFCDQQCQLSWGNQRRAS